MSGWRYAPFRGKFYPKGLRQDDELSYAAQRFPTIEINGSFYSLQKPEYYERWRDQTPDDFVFAVKGGRFITHMKKLRDVEVPLANFFASGLLRLEGKLGPLLWQLPANLPYDLERLEAFFELLPRDTFAAARLAKKHDPWLRGRVAVSTKVRRPLRHALEIRNPACATPEFVDLMRRHDVGSVIADTAGKFPYMEDLTSDFVYVRLHGDVEIYASRYSARAIDAWAERVLGWVGGARDVYVYFDNDIHAHAPFDALALIDAIAKKANSRQRRRTPGR